MVTSRGPLVAALSFVVVLCGCKASSEINEEVARGTIESGPMKLEGEQVTLTDSQIQCGLQNEYWDPPTSTSADHSSAHLTSKARALKFNDDLIIHDPSSRVPYVQIRGDFPIQVDSITAIKNGEDNTAKLVEAKAGVKIEDACFQTPPPLMGVKHGNFSAESPVVFHLHFDESGWHADKVVHWPATGDGLKRQR